MQDPVLQAALGRRLEQFPEIARAEVRHHGDACARDVLVDEEPAECDGEEPEGIELAQSVVDFEGGEPE